MVQDSLTAGPRNVNPVVVTRFFGASEYLLGLGPS